MTLDYAKIKKLREEQGLSIRKLAVIADVHRNTLQEIEAGQKSVVKTSTIENIANALGVDPKTLFLGGE